MSLDIDDRPASPPWKLIGKFLALLLLLFAVLYAGGWWMGRQRLLQQVGGLDVKGAGDAFERVDRGIVSLTCFDAVPVLARCHARRLRGLLIGHP